MDGVDTLLQYLTTDPAWRYEALEPYFSESECDNRGYMVRAKASLIRILLTGAGWTREDATLVCSKFLEDSYIQAVPATKEPEPFEDGAALYKFQNAGVAEIKELLSQADRIGLGLKNQGAAPKYVAVLIPGLASTALECWDSQVAPEWNQERIWLDVLKIGKFAHLKKIQQMLSSNDDTVCPSIIATCSLSPPLALSTLTITPTILAHVLASLVPCRRRLERPTRHQGPRVRGLRRHRLLVALVHDAEADLRVGLRHSSADRRRLRRQEHDRRSCT